MAHAVVRTDKVYGTDNRTGVVSVSFNGDIDNGNVVLLTGLKAGSREVYTATAVAADSPIGDVVLVASPEVMYDERNRNLDGFYNVKGKAARGYRLHSGDIFSVTKEALAGAATPAVGDVVELAAGTKLNIAAKDDGATEGSTVIGKIIDINVVGRYTYYAIEVA